MTKYERNLEFFRINSEPLYKIITEEKSNFETMIVDVEDSMNCIVQNKNARCFVHSIYNKDREIEEAFKDVDREVTMLVVFGIGFGHSMKYIQDNFKELKEIVIIEPDLNLFKRVLKDLDFSNIVRFFIGKDITFIVNKRKESIYSVIGEKFRKSSSYKFEFIINLAYKALYPEYIEDVQKKLVKFIRDTRTNIITTNVSKERWTANVIKNIMVQPDVWLGSFMDKFKNKTAIIVSAGPSLNKNIHLLKEAKGKAVIFAPGSAIKILDSHGVIPDFRFATDGWAVENNIFKNIDTKSAPLVYSNILYDEILPNYKGKKINMLLDVDGLSKYIYKKLKLKSIIIPSGFSISNIVLSIIISMNFKRVVFMGQDMCYTDGKIYAKGSWTKKDAPESEKLIKTKDIYDEEVYTSDTFLSMKSLFERIIKSSSNIEFINASEGGLGLEGAENKNFQDVLMDLDENERIEDIKRLVFETYEIKEYEKKIHDILLDIKQENQDVLKINNQRLKRIKKLNKYSQKNIGINKLNYELDYMKNYENKLQEIKFYEEVTLPLLGNNFYSIRKAFEYSGEDKYKIAISKGNILMGYINEVDKYTKLLISLIDKVINKSNSFI